MGTHRGMARVPARVCTLAVLILVSVPAVAQRRDLTLQRPPRENWPAVSWELRQAVLASAPDAMVTAIGIEGSAPLDVGGIAALGGEVVARARGLVRLRCPAARLRDLATSVTGLERLRSPHEPLEIVESEGVELTGMRLYHDSGSRGRGVRVAIIDLGFAGLDEAIDAGEIPSRIERVNYSSTDFQATTYHGTAVTEVVHDMAPASDLVAIKVEDEISLAKAADYCIEHGVEVINHSVAWFNTNFYDGTGIVCDIARDAVERGITWVNAAGNSAQRHWEGPFIDEDQDGWCEFRSGDEGIELAAFYGSTVRVALAWGDWQARQADFDLFLLDDRGRIVASSRDDQGSGQDPIEFIRFDVDSTGRYSIAISHEKGPADPPLEVYVFNHDVEPALQIRSSSLVAPADAAEVIAVGAVRAGSYDIGPAEPFSSRGPSNAGLSKPDIMGPDFVSNATYGFFAGTSAASPHVAGAVAVMLAREPGRSPGSVRRGLLELAWFLGDENIYGHGALFLDDETPPWPPPGFETEPTAISTHEITMRAAARRDPSGTQYRIVGLGAAPDRPWDAERGFVASGLTPNTAYRFRVRQRDHSPRLNEAAPGDVHEAWTHIEAPERVVAHVLSPTGLAARITGRFTGLDRGASSLLLRIQGEGLDRGEWGRARDRLIDGLRPNTRYRLWARARNAIGITTAMVGPTSCVTLATTPPAPRLEEAAGGTLTVRLEAGENPADTELALYNATRATFVRPSGLESLEPAFAPPGLWQRVVLDGLSAETTFELRALARNRAGRLTRLSTPLLATTGATVSSDAEGGDGDRVITGGGSVPARPAGAGLSYRRDASGDGPSRPALALSDVGPTDLVLDLDESARTLLDSGLVAFLDRQGPDGALASRRVEGHRVIERGLRPDALYVYRLRFESGGTVAAISVPLEVTTEAVMPLAIRVAPRSASGLRLEVGEHTGWSEARWRLTRGDEIVWQSEWLAEERTDVAAGLVARAAPDAHPVLAQVQVRNRSGRPLGWSRPVAAGLGEIEADTESGRAAVVDAGSPAMPRPTAKGISTGPAPPDASETEVAAAPRAPAAVPGGPEAGDAPADTAGRVALTARPERWESKVPRGPQVLGPTVVSFYAGENGASGSALVECTDGTTSRFVELKEGRARFEGLRPNERYTFRLSGSAVPGSRESSWVVTTAIEAPAGLELLAREDHAVVLQVDGSLSRLDTGLSGVSIEGAAGHSAEGLRRWTRTRRIRVEGLTPDTAYRFFARARNGEGVESDRTAALLIRTAPTSPPGPRIDAVEPYAIAVRLEAGENPVETELCLEDVSRGLYLSPHGRTSARPVFAPADRWQHVVVSGLRPATRFALRARTRAADGRLGPVSDPVEVTTAPLDLARATTMR